MEDVARVLVCAELVGSQADYHKPMRAACLHLLKQKTSQLVDRDGRPLTIPTSDLEDFSEKIFAVLQERCSEAADSLLENLEDPVQSMDWAYQTLALRHLQSLDERIAGNKFPILEVDEKVEEWTLRYVESYRKAHSTLEIPDLAEKRVIDHDALYVEPKYRARSMHAKELADVLLAARRTPGSPVLSSRELGGVVHRCVLLGNPGAGKSTTSAWMALQIWEKRGLLPIFLPLKAIEFDGHGFYVVEEVERLLASRYQCKPPVGLVEKKARNGSLLVIFDGLDELVNNSDRHAAVRVIESFGTSYPLCSILVTSRIIGYKLAALRVDDFDEFVIESFDRSQVERYFRNWIALQGTAVDVNVEILVADFMRSSRGIEELTSNPLLLAFICILYRGYRHIPRRRAELYRRCVELLLTDWDRARGIEMLYPESQEYEVILSRWAFDFLSDPSLSDGLHEDIAIERGIEALAGEGEKNVSIARRAVRNLLELCRGRGWMFTDVGVDGEDRDLFAFTHRSFSEYFAALALDRQCETVNELAGRLAAQIMYGRWEVLGQICLALRERRAVAGGSRTALNLLDRFPVPPSEYEFAKFDYSYPIPDLSSLNYLEILERCNAVTDFVIGAQEVVALNEEALKRSATMAFRLMLRGRRRPFARLLSASRTDPQSVEAMADRLAGLLGQELTLAFANRDWVQSEDTRFRVWSAVHFADLAGLGEDLHESIPFVKAIDEKVYFDGHPINTSNAKSQFAWSIALHTGRTSIAARAAAVARGTSETYKSLFESCNPPDSSIGPATSFEWLARKLSESNGTSQRSFALSALRDLSDFPFGEIFNLEAPVGYGFASPSGPRKELIQYVVEASRRLTAHREATLQGWTLLLMGALDGATSLGNQPRLQTIEAWGLQRYFSFVSTSISGPFQSSLESWLSEAFNIWSSEAAASS